MLVNVVDSTHLIYSGKYNNIMGDKKNKHLHMLDFTRFIAALAVLFSHYRHFYYENGVKPLIFVVESQPMYSVFQLFYDYGFYAVQYFWILSGFVFHYTYSERMLKRQVKFKYYIWNRITRLYPLHLFTLVLVTILSFNYYINNGFYFVYQVNDVKHFLLNLFMLSNWGLEDGDSFNGPIWSVSVEIFSYLLFFVLSSYFSVYRYKLCILVMVASLVLFYFFKINIFYGSFCFYLGGATYFAYDWLVYKKKSSSGIIMICVIVGSLLLLVSIFCFVNNMYSFDDKLAKLGLLMLFSLFVLVLSLLQDLKPLLLSSTKPLGDVSYSMYLIHFPIQLFLVSFLSEFVFLDSALFLFCFVTLTFLISFILFYRLEMPAKAALRKVIL